MKTIKNVLFMILFISSFIGLLIPKTLPILSEVNITLFFVLLLSGAVLFDELNN